MNRFRVLVSALMAIVVTLGLFLFMFKLISSGRTSHQALEAIAGIRFGPIDIPDELTTRQRQLPKKPKPPHKLPAAPKMQVSKMEPVVLDIPTLDLPRLDLPMVAGGGLYMGNFSGIDRTEEGDSIPLVVIRPMYPREAQMKGLEGWVQVEFTITATGTVKNPRVTQAQPPRVFNREAIRAVLKFKFKPRIVNGVAVERPATQVITFSLDRSGT